MASSFWQLSGPGSNFERRWDQGNPNQHLANALFGSTPIKHEGGITLVMGVKEDGSSQILIPHKMGYLCNPSRRWKGYPYTSSDFASLSPIYVETPERLTALIDERQNKAKTTKAKKDRRDTSKANGRFCGGPRNLLRANFERGRAFWRLLSNEFEDMSMYGYPNIWWRKSIGIFSFAFSFWRPDGSGKASAEHLLVTSITEFDVQSKEQGKSWSFKIEEQLALQNADELESSIKGVSAVLPQKEAVKGLQDRLGDAATCGPVVLLLHEFGVAERDQLSSLGFDTSKWVHGLGPLLGYDDSQVYKKETAGSSKMQSRRSRSRSPPRTYTNRRDDSDDLTKFKIEDRRDEKANQTTFAPSADVSKTQYGGFYVVSVSELYKTVTGKHWERISPSVVFDTLTRDGRRSDAEAIPRNVELDSTRVFHLFHIMQAWLTMVKGPFIDEQMLILQNQTQNPPLPSTNISFQNSVENRTQSITGEIEGLHRAAQQRPFVDPLAYDSDSD